MTPDRRDEAQAVPEAPSRRSLFSRHPTAPYIVAALGVTVVAAIVLKLMGRVWWCGCGQRNLWAGDIWSKHCSQHLLDPYTFTHISHGLLFYCLLAVFAKNLNRAQRFFIAVLVECGWEVLENSPLIINRYRSVTIALDYFGDSIVNALADIGACALGFAIVFRLGWRVALVLLAVMELLLLIFIRDNLLLNIVMLLYPIDAIKNWQTPAG